MIDRAATDEVERQSPVRLALESIFLRRKFRFWRRVAYMLLALVILIGVVSWQRLETSRTECAQALSIYSEKASDQQFEKVAIDLMDDVWISLEGPDARRLPAHYQLIRPNWQKAITPGIDLPVAICASSHVRLFERGRNVLFRTATGLQVRWVPEGDCEKYLQIATRVTRTRPERDPK